MKPITRDTVRIAMLAAQGLLTQPKRPAEPGDILPLIRRMQYLQIDTIQAVHRSHYLVLWSRLGDFEDTLLATRDAQGLYKRYGGFMPLDSPEKWMRRNYHGKD